MLEFDHIAVSGETLDAASEAVEAALGVSMQPGGAHDVFHTHNRLLGLEDGLYLEAIAINPEAPAPARPRWFDLDRFRGPPRLTNWVCRCGDLEAALADLPEGFGAPVELQRGDLRWRMAVPSNGALPYDNCAPAVMQWLTPVHPATRLVQSGVRLRRLTLRHPQADALRASLSTHLRDDRVAFEMGAPELAAAFETPHGPRELAR